MANYKGKYIGGMDYNDDVIMDPNNLDKRRGNAKDRQPENRRQARLYNFTLMMDMFYDIRSWPVWAVWAYYNVKKSFRERFNLFYFFVFNGMKPLTAVMMCTMKDVDLHNMRGIPGDYSKQTIYDMKMLVKKAQNGTLFGHGKLIWDMHKKRVVSS